MDTTSRQAGPESSNGRPIRLLIGIDDTDNAESRGTGFRARMLGAELSDRGLGRLRGVSRHQLLVHDDIPYTSHNSALCLDVDNVRSVDDVAGHCRQFLLEQSAPGSDAGLCIGAWESVPGALTDYGRRAQREVLDQAVARQQARESGVLLEGLTGDHGGIIGALAAVGLRSSGRDGRFVWLEAIRELAGSMPAARLLSLTGIDEIRSLDGESPGPGERVCIDPWPRPVLLDGRAVLLVQRSNPTGGTHEWELVAREIVRRY